MTINQLQPQLLWESFYQLTQIPRPSGKRKEISDFMVGFGKKLGLETIQDEIGNVLIRKPATKGKENIPGVILQAHLDMVPQKNADIKHDFETDPICAYIDGDWVTAKGTTLGADDGIGVAAAMAVLADNTLEHPAVEAFFTIDEETGMYGAFALEGGVLKGQTLLNLDSETEGELYIGCAGGLDANIEFDIVNYAPVPEGDVAFKIDLTGLKGGHSGVDINLQRANANKLMVRFLKDAIEDVEARLACIEGGNMRNAIPRDAHAIVTVPKEGTDDLLQLVEEFESLFVQEYDGIEEGISLTATQTELPHGLIPEEIQDALINSLTACPHGVYRIIPEMPDVVETSNNLSIIETKPNKILIKCLLRSSVESRKDELASIVESVFSMAGAKIEFTGAYPGWKPNVKSNILHTMKQVYADTFGVEPRIITIHAGLECAILGRNYPNMDMISFGPTIKHPHSPDEKVEIKSVEKFYHFLLQTLKNLK
ncbi:MAG: aminoacyl-histidine dipeptidase [Paludibacteraceae bacterium]|nr:aminoacyl-histidine dipeptidase [Paludibacteraceae bacterium]